MVNSKGMHATSAFEEFAVKAPVLSGLRFDWLRKEVTMEKFARMFVLLIVGMALLAPTALAISFEYNYGATLAVGEYRTTSKKVKEFTGGAGVDPEVHNPSGVRVRYNMRKPNGNLAGQDVYKTKRTGAFYIPYLSGEGNLGRRYGLTARNTVENDRPVTTSGTWGP